MVWAFIRTGLKQMWLHRRVLLIFYAFHLLAGLLLMLPWRGVLQDFLGNSLMNEKLAGKIDIHFLMELFNSASEFNDIMVAAMLLVGTVYLLGSLFLSGGAIHLFVHHSEYAPINFWGSAANHMGRFVRLFLWMIPVFLLLVIAPSSALEKLQDAVYGGDAYQSVKYWGGWLRLILRYLGIVLCYLIFDYGRIYIVETGERRTRAALVRSITFVFRNLRRTFTLIFAVWLIGVLLLVIYNPLANWLSGPGAGAIFGLIVLQQSFVLLRNALKLTLFAGEVSLFKTLFFSK